MLLLLPRRLHWNAQAVKMNGYSYGSSRAGPGAWGEGDGSRNDRGAGEMIPHLNDIGAYVDVRVEELRPHPVSNHLFAGKTKLMRTR